MIVAYIDEHRATHGVEPICEVLTDAGTTIAPSTYYAAKTRPPSARSVSDAATTDVLQRVHRENYGVYGIRKMHARSTGKATGWRGAPSRGSCAPRGCAGQPVDRTADHHSGCRTGDPAGPRRAGVDRGRTRPVVGR